MSETTQSKSAERHKRARRVATMARVPSVESLVGAHPDALRDIYSAGEPVQPTALDGLMEARLLAFEPLVGAFMLTRPLVQLYSRITPWKGKVFEPGGTAGADKVARFTPHHFHCELGPSLLDGKPTLIFQYDQPENPWLMRKRVDELRSAGDLVAIGPIFGLSSSKPTLWWGVKL